MKFDNVLKQINTTFKPFNNYLNSLLQNKEFTLSLTFVLILLISNIFKGVTSLVLNFINNIFVKVILILLALLILPNNCVVGILLIVLIALSHKNSLKIEKFNLPPFKSNIDLKPQNITSEEQLPEVVNKVSNEPVEKFTNDLTPSGFNSVVEPEHKDKLEPVSTFKDELDAQGINHVMGFSGSVQGASI